MTAWVRVRTAALLLGAASAAPAWQARPEKAIVAGPIAVDAAGDVLAAIGTTAPRRGLAAAVVKLSHAGGTQLWRRRLRAGGSERSDELYDLQAAANGDVVTAGLLDDNGHSSFFVARLAGRDGRERWRRLVTGRVPPDNEERANAVAVDASGDVIAAGTIENAATALPHSTNDFAVFKFAGETGEERWRFVTNGTADQFDWALAVAVDGNGDVVVIGRLTEMLSPDPFSFGDTVSTVMKLARDDGRLLWRRDLETVGGRSVRPGRAG